jgi:ribonuclease P protein component
VRREGKRIRTEHLEVRALASLLPHPRVGIVVPKHKHNSVERNRLKRRLRELIRTRLLPELPAMDVVVRTLPDAYSAPFDALAEEIERAGSRIRRLGGGGAP